jgi:hypothetical protein
MVRFNLELEMIIMKLKTLILLALAFIVAMDDGFAFQPYSATDVRAIEAGSQAAEQILKETDFVKLTSLINESKAETNILTRRSMIGDIFRATGSNESMKLENYGNLIIPSRVNAGKMDSRKDGNVVRQDLFIKCGRAAWILEQLLGCELPTLTETTTDLEMRNFDFETNCKIEESFVPAGKLINTSVLSVQDRLSLASSTNTLGVIMARLTKDSDVQVRRLLAANPHTPVFVICQLRDFDSDTNVKSLAIKNLQTSRTLAE